MGSLMAALASALEARTRNGTWLLRIEDLDPPRTISGSADRILRTLDDCGFRWDGPVLYQSSRTEAYRAALETLLANGDAFACACSRTEIAAAARVGPEGPVYPGTCRKGLPPSRRERALRFRVPDGTLSFEDRLQGTIHQNVADEIGDFVIRRADGYFAYQLAVVVDDAWQGVNDVVRGADLLQSTPRQIWLQQRLGLPTPGYLHVPLLLDDDGRKLSKQARSLPVDSRRAGAALFDALRLLLQSPPHELARAGVAEIWDWAVEYWKPERLKGVARLSIAGK